LSFGSIAPQISELRGVKNRPFPFTRHIAYTTACCYRTSRDEYRPPNYDDDDLLHLLVLLVGATRDRFHRAMLAQSAVMREYK